MEILKDDGQKEFIKGIKLFFIHNAVFVQKENEQI